MEDDSRKPISPHQDENQQNGSSQATRQSSGAIPESMGIELTPALILALQTYMRQLRVIAGEHAPPPPPELMVILAPQDQPGKRAGHVFSVARMINTLSKASAGGVFVPGASPKLKGTTPNVRYMGKPARDENLDWDMSGGGGEDGEKLTQRMWAVQLLSQGGVLKTSTSDSDTPEPEPISNPHSPIKWKPYSPQAQERKTDRGSALEQPKKEFKGPQRPRRRSVHDPYTGRQIGDDPQDPIHIDAYSHSGAEIPDMLPGEARQAAMQRLAQKLKLDTPSAQVQEVNGVRRSKWTPLVGSSAKEQDSRSSGMPQYVGPEYAGLEARPRKELVDQGVQASQPVTLVDLGVQVFVPITATDQGIQASVPVAAADQGVQVLVSATTADQGVQALAPVTLEHQGVQASVHVTTEDQGSQASVPAVFGDQGVRVQTSTASALEHQGVQSESSEPITSGVRLGASVWHAQQVDVPAVAEEAAVRELVERGVQVTEFVSSEIQPLVAEQDFGQGLRVVLPTEVSGGVNTGRTSDNREASLPSTSSNRDLTPSAADGSPDGKHVAKHSPASEPLQKGHSTQFRSAETSTTAFNSDGGSPRARAVSLNVQTDEAWEAAAPVSTPERQSANVGGVNRPAAARVSTPPGPTTVSQVYVQKLDEEYKEAKGELEQELVDVKEMGPPAPPDYTAITELERVTKDFETWRKDFREKLSTAHAVLSKIARERQKSAPPSPADDAPAARKKSSLFGIFKKDKQDSPGAKPS